MSGRLRIGIVVAVFAAALAVWVPVSGANGGLRAPAVSAADGPIATKSGAVVNYVTTGKIKIRRRIEVSFVCSVQCSLTSSLLIKGPGARLSDVETATDVAPGLVLTHFFKFSKRAVAFIKANASKFRVVSRVSATDAATGAPDTISHSFRLKR